MSLRPALTVAQVRALRRARVKGTSLTTLSERFDVDRGAVVSALYGRSPYSGIHDPPPVPPGRPAAALPLTMAQVREVRLAGKAGVTILGLGRKFQVARETVKKALYGRPPYHEVRGPAPMPPVRPQNVSLLSDASVRRARRMRLEGVALAEIAQRMGISVGTAGNAVYGRLAYATVSDPGPVHLGMAPSARALTRAQVGEVRERAARGDSFRTIARDLGAGLHNIQRAAYGQGAYRSIGDPPPLVPVAPKPRALSDEQVRELRRKRVAGAGFEQLQLEAGVSRTTIRNAVYGRGPYRGIWYPYPPETGRDGAYPALTLKEVAEMRREARSGTRLDVLGQQYHVHTETARRAVYGRIPYHRILKPPPLAARQVRPGRTLTSEEVSKARRLRLQGAKLFDIGDQLHVSPATVLRALFGRSPYSFVRDPPPLQPGSPLPVLRTGGRSGAMEGRRLPSTHHRALTLVQVQTARRLARQGVPRDRLAREYGVDLATLRGALVGRRPYDVIHDPPPLPSRGRGAAPTLSMAQVGELRRSARAGASSDDLARRFGVGVRTVRTALTGRPPYDGISNPPRVSLRRRGRGPSLTVDRVREARRGVRAGASVKHVAARLGISAWTARQAVYGHAPYDKVAAPPPLKREQVARRMVLPAKVVEEVRQARRLRLDGGDLGAISRSLKRHPATVRKMLQGRQWYGQVNDPPPIPAGAIPRDYSFRPRAGVAESVRRAREMRMAGAELPRIAKAIGRSYGTTSSMLVRSGVYARYPEPPPVRMAARPGEAKVYHSKATLEKVARARRLRARGLTFQRIGAELGLSEASAHNMALGLGNFADIRDPPPAGRVRAGGPRLRYGSAVRARAEALIARELPTREILRRLRLRPDADQAVLRWRRERGSRPSPGQAGE